MRKLIVKLIVKLILDQVRRLETERVGAEAIL